jgi:formyltetrahydrofolate deformylase
VETAKPPHYVLTVSCPDAVGLVAAVSGLVASWSGWLTEVANHADPVTGQFFMRNEVAAASLDFGIDEFRRRFAPVAEKHRMRFEVHDSEVPKRVMILVSRQEHCLADLLHRWRTGELHFELRGVISNHDQLRSFVEWHGVPYHHVPVTPETKEAAFGTIDHLLGEQGIDLVILARYMQILPPALCQRYEGRIVNIHHSFLPSFVGGRPYEQACARGVKLIGATSHFVTADLDQGPIIEQDVVRVSHADTVGDMVRLGRDVEKTVLARAVRFVLEDRVIVHENRTVVFA